MYSGGGYATVRGVGHMEWSMGFQTFVKGSPQDPQMMEVQMKQFVLRRVRLWSKLGNTKPKKKLALVDVGAMVCTVGLNMFGDLGSRDQCLHWGY